MYTFNFVRKLCLLKDIPQRQPQRTHVSVHVKRTDGSATVKRKVAGGHLLRVEKTQVRGD